MNEDTRIPLAPAASDMNYEKEFVPFFHVLADVAREITLRYFRRAYVIHEKDDKTPVTEADREIETSLRDRIQKQFPHHGIVGEEFGKENIQAEWVWVIDPIDGTKSFATGRPLFGTVIGLVHNNRPVVGLIDQGFTDERWVGITDQFCLHNNQRVRVAQDRPLERVRFLTAGPEMYQDGHRENFEALRQLTQWTLYGGDCYSYGQLASGFVDLVLERYLCLHDYIGLVPLVTGAGGHISDWEGKAITLSSGDTIIAASSSRLAKEVLSILNRGCP